MKNLTHLYTYIWVFQIILLQLYFLPASTCLFFVYTSAGGKLSTCQKIWAVILNTFPLTSYIKSEVWSTIWSSVVKKGSKGTNDRRSSFELIHWRSDIQVFPFLSQEYFFKKQSPINSRNIIPRSGGCKRFFLSYKLQRESQIQTFCHTLYFFTIQSILYTPSLSKSIEAYIPVTHLLRTFPFITTSRLETKLTHTCSPI